jgi:hypothetical protein
VSGMLSKRLARLEQRSRPDPAPVRVVVVTSDNEEGGPGPDEGRPVRQFTIRLDRPSSDEEEADA